MKEIDSNVKSVNPKCQTIAEIYPGIEEEVVRVGADVYRLYGVVDTIAHEYEHGEGGHMASSKGPGDWFDYLAGISSFRAFAGGKASWMLGYSWDGAKGVDPREAMKNLFLAQITAGANVWDARGHVMSGSNDMPTRTQVFQWIQEHEKTFYLPRMPINPVGVYFSPATRDYFARDFMQSYKGALQLLMKSHLEFQIVTPRTLADFRGRILILPDVRCLGEREIASLKSYADSGSLLAATAQTGSCDESGAPRNGNSFREALGSRLNYRPDAAGEFVPGLLRAANFQAAVQIEASPLVFVQVATVDGTPHVFIANFDGLVPNRKLTQTPQTGVRVSFLADGPRKIRVLPFLGEAQEIPAKWSDGRVACTLPPIDKGMVVWIE